MIRKLFPLTIFLAATAAVVVACGPKEEEKKPEPTALEAAGKLSLNEPSKMFRATGDALASANMSGQGTSLRLNEAVSGNDALCSKYGRPWDATANEVLRESNDYAPLHFYCFINSKVNETLETLPGFFAQQASIMCTLEKNLKLNTEEFTAEGKAYIPANESPKNLNLVEDCWPQGQPDNQESVPMTSVVGRKLADSTGWQYEVEMTSSQIGNFKMRYFNKDGRFGFLRYQSTVGTDGTGTGITAVVDVNQGVILYDAFDDRATGNNDDYKKINRLRVKGVFDGNLKFKEFTEGRALSYISGSGFSPVTGDTHTFSMYTVDGKKDRGYMFKTFTNRGEADENTVVEKYKKCTGSSTNCDGQQDIGTTTEMKAFVFRSEATTTAWRDFVNRKPVCEPATDGASQVVYSSLMPMTGAFGKCE